MRSIPVRGGIVSVQQQISGEFPRSNRFPSMILGMVQLQKYAGVNFILGGNAVITRKPKCDQNIETMTFGGGYHRFWARF
jgi:hypothetical protein